MTPAYTFTPIGIIESPYQEKFAIPRQSGLVTAAQGKILLQQKANNLALVRGLENFSHLWIIFVFNATAAQGWKPLVKPPRLGGNSKLGVLATRSTFRPNPIGMSVVKLDKITYLNKQLSLHISGLDLLDKTPVLDIKPYIPYSDAILNAKAGFAQQAPSTQLSVEFTPKAKQQLAPYLREYPQLDLLITQVLSQDPRPAYKQQKQDDKVYGMALYNLNITWQVHNTTKIIILSVTRNLKIQD
jgi:tRNA-Thr(GGU) m(6)t(6)A37 methyltransferase TsaA